MPDGKHLNRKSQRCEEERKQIFEKECYGEGRMRGMGHWGSSSSFSIGVVCFACPTVSLSSPPTISIQTAGSLSVRASSGSVGSGRPIPLFLPDIQPIIHHQSPPKSHRRVPSRSPRPPSTAGAARTQHDTLFDGWTDDGHNNNKHRPW
jgi:hypothetical protein